MWVYARQLTNLTLPPQKRMQIGYLMLDTAQVALEENYLSDGTFAGLSGLSTPAGKLTRLDVQALKRRELVWEAVDSRGLTHLQAQLTLHTDVVRNAWSRGFGLGVSQPVQGCGRVSRSVGPNL